MNTDDARCDGSHRSLATELDLGALVRSMSVLLIACFVLSMACFVNSISMLKHHVDIAVSVYLTSAASRCYRLLMSADGSVDVFLNNGSHCRPISQPTTPLQVRHVPIKVSTMTHSRLSCWETRTSPTSPERFGIAPKRAEDEVLLAWGCSHLDHDWRQDGSTLFGTSGSKEKLGTSRLHTHDRRTGAMHSGITKYHLV